MTPDEILADLLGGSWEFEKNITTDMQNIDLNKLQKDIKDAIGLLKSKDLQHSLCASSGLSGRRSGITDWGLAVDILEGVLFDLLGENPQEIEKINQAILAKIPPKDGPLEYRMLREMVNGEEVITRFPC